MKRESEEIYFLILGVYCLRDRYSGFIEERLRECEAISDGSTIVARAMRILEKVQKEHPSVKNMLTAEFSEHNTFFSHLEVKRVEAYMELGVMKYNIRVIAEVLSPTEVRFV